MKLSYDERLVPRRPGEWEHRHSYLMYLRHLAAYRFAKPMGEGQRVLDLGCGAGYGAVLIAGSAGGVIALDVALNALPTSEPKTATAAFVAGDSLRLPLRDETFDLVVSFQVIEHIEHRRALGFLRETGRVLAKEGLALITTPNRKLRLLPYQKPWNKHHKKEYNAMELKSLLRQAFPNVQMLGLTGRDELMRI